nr:TIR domain-containing protein [Hyalangium gracile]
MKQAERYSDQVTADIEGKPLVPAQGIATTGTAMASGKQAVRFFVSYAHDNRLLVEALVKELSTHFAASARYVLIPWIDRDILLGERWKESIEKAIKACDFGLMLISPAFFASKFIGEKELPHFVGAPDNPKIKPVLPVGLVQVSFDRHDLKGLGEHQVFLFQSDRTQGRYYDQMPAGARRREFVYKLYLAIEKRLDAFFGSPPPSWPPSAPRGTDAGTADALAAHVPVPEETDHFQRTRGHRIALGELERIAAGRSDSSAHVQARDALEELESWASNPDSSPFFALLGEYGIGKTTTLKQFTRHLLKERRARPSLPLPIYVDLRDYVSEAHDKESVPTIEQLLSGVIQRSWEVRDRTITAQDVLRLVQEEGAFILFDGLDEKIVHLPPDRARAFIRTLWAVLPDAARSRDTLPTGKRRGKLLVSCRSHYFPDVWSQNSMLVGEDREGFDRKQFPALCLLPFTEEQIRDYLADFLGSDPERGAEAFEVIASIHNLRDLAERPYLLTLISGHLGELEELRARGEKVNAARLYELVVRSWLNRDDGKHQIEAGHKRRLMEELAAALWRDGTKQWDVDRLESWLDEYLAASPSLTEIYKNKDRTVLKEDLRTATFVLRPTTEEKHFRFAHTSLQEYFLAAHLERALIEGKVDRWDLPMVSRETLDFLGQILALEPQLTVALRAMESILGGENLRAAVLAFAYWVNALRQGAPVPAPTRVKLAGANLDEWHICGGGPTQPLNLRRADLSTVRLNRARLEHVELGDADLTSMRARQALFLNVRASRARAQGADLRGLKWREGSLVGADLRGAQVDGCQWIWVSLTGAILPEGWERHATHVKDRQESPLAQASTVSLVPSSGHSSRVTACAWSPDGQRVLSGSDDRAMKVWDAASGECLLTLSGHGGPVNACAWSPDGQCVLSGSSDRAMKVWDAASGECLLTLSGHGGEVNACAWSPDGQRVLSGSDDGAMKVWDAASGECLLTLSGHGAWVDTCAWSPDGQRVLSGAWDGAIKVWDAASGECLLTLSGHGGRVTACAWSPDSQRVLSGAWDRAMKVWDAASGECLLTLSGHSGSVNACAWSPDGQRVLSGSSDRAMKVWDAASGECLLTLSGHGGPITACAWSPDGQRVLSGGRDGAMKVWDAASGECLLTLSRHFGSVTACAWSPDGQRVLSGSGDGAMKVWDAASGECLLTLFGVGAWVSACAWSPDSQRVLSGGRDRAMKVWDAASGECLLTLSGHGGPVNACAWSPDGQRVLSGAWDGALKVWDAVSGERLLTLSGHGGPVNACAWSPDGHRVISGSDDGAMKVWDVASGQCLWSGLQLPEGQTASIDGGHGRILHASAEAWRWLGWRWTDPATSQLRILPAETFGSLAA